MDPALNNHHVSTAPNMIKYKNNSATAEEVTIPLAIGKILILLYNKYSLCGYILGVLKHTTTYYILTLER